MKSGRVLITGISGFVGSHLAEYVLEQGLEVYGTIRWRSKLDNIEHIKDKLKLIEGDIRDSYSMQKAIAESEPDFVFSLAAQSFVPASWRSPSETISTNVEGTLNVLEACRNGKTDPRIVVVGSSEEYGMVYETEIPIKETNPLRPLSPYGVSKVATDMLGYQYHQSYGMKIVRTRSFNTTGPRRGEPFATSNFAKQIAEIEKGLRKPVMYVGNLDAKRDFTDVRDVVDAYWQAANHGELGEVYNICSEVAWRIGYVLHELLSMSKADKIKVECDPDRMRPSDVQILLCDCAKFRERTGWKPAIAFKQTLSDLLDYWRAIV
jgi:GDP-4-dehydro-6-deoxy-D-mannose reductase